MLTGIPAREPRERRIVGLLDHSSQCPVGRNVEQRVGGDALGRDVPAAEQPVARESGRCGSVSQPEQAKHVGGIVVVGVELVRLAGDGNVPTARGSAEAGRYLATDVRP